MKIETLRLHKVTQIDQGSTLLNSVNLHILRGEIMGLICVNAYGLEALIRLICQNVPIYYGHVYFAEKLVNSYQHSSMRFNQVSVIDKRSRLLENLTVSDNIFVMRPGFKKYLIPDRLLEMELAALTGEIGISIQADAKVDDLTFFERSVVELLRAVVSGARLVILRDISNFICASDLVGFHDLIRHYSEQGVSFMYICSHYEEVFQICGKAALMDNGKILKVLDRENFEPENMPRFIKQELSLTVPMPVILQPSVISLLPGSVPTPKSVLEFRGVTTGNIRDFNATVRAGECFVFFDRSNTAFTDFVALMARRTKPWRGDILLDGHVWNHRKSAVFQQNVLVIAENPTQSMLFPNMSAIDNLCFPLESRMPFIWAGERIRESVLKEYEQYIGEDIYARDIAGLSLLSLYNLVYYRALLYKPKVVFCVQPFAGADLYLRHHVIHLIHELQSQGIAVVILAVSLQDNLIPASRLLILEHGRLSGEFERAEFHLLR
jgi:ribose transport system ATP-binding protein